MIKHPALPLLLALTFGMGATSSCKLFGKKKKQQEAVRYNDALVAYNKRIHKLASALGTKLGKRMANQGDIQEDDLDEAVETIQAELKKIRREVKAMPIPDHPTARDLHRAYLVFLNEEQRLISRIEDVVEVVTTPDPRRRRQHRRVREILRDITSSENKALEKLRKVQKRFARAHNIKLMF